MFIMLGELNWNDVKRGNINENGKQKSKFGRSQIAIDLNFSLFNHYIMNSMKLVIPLHSLYWSIHTKDECKRGTAFAFIFGVN